MQHPRIPIMVGGNGPKVTWRLAALYADELNITGKDPEAAAAVIPIIRSRCEEIGRDFDSLRISLLTWARHIPPAGDQRVDVLGRYAAAGLDRVMIRPDSMGVEALESLAKDAGSAGIAPANLSPS